MSLTRSLAGALSALITVGPVTAAAEPLRWDMVYAEPPDVAVLIERDLDYVGLDGFDTAPETVAALQAAGIRVWCYLSAGTLEDWRPDFADYEAAHANRLAAGMDRLIGKTYDGWAGERWLDIRAHDAVLPLMQARLAMCVEKGFDLVDFDNLDGYGAVTGFPLTEDDAIAYARLLADAARDAGMGSIFNNVPDLADRLEPWFAGQLMEDCVLYDFCAAGAPFVAAGKPVFNAEYAESWEDEGRPFDLQAVCDAGTGAGVALLVKSLDLSMQAAPCP